MHVRNTLSADALSTPGNLTVTGDAAITGDVTITGAVNSETGTPFAMEWTFAYTMANGTKTLYTVPAGRKLLVDSVAFVVSTAFDGVAAPLLDVGKTGDDDAYIDGVAQAATLTGGGALTSPAGWGAELSTAGSVSLVAAGDALTLDYTANGDETAGAGYLIIKGQLVAAATALS